MSRTTMQAIWPGERHDNFLELRNSYGSGPVIWEPICGEYLGTTKSYDYPAKGWMQRLDELWPLYARQDIPEYIRAVLCLTYDRFYVLKEHYARMANDIRLFMERYPRSGGAYHLPAIAELFASGPDYPAIAMWCTSVTSDPFEGQYNKEKEDYDPFDWDTSESLYTVLDALRIEQELNVIAAAKKDQG